LIDAGGIDSACAFVTAGGGADIETTCGEKLSHISIIRKEI
jgi:3-phosphoglycerate kinase